MGLRKSENPEYGVNQIIRLISSFFILLSEECDLDIFKYCIRMTDALKRPISLFLKTVNFMGYHRCLVISLTYWNRSKD